MALSPTTDRRSQPSRQELINFAAQEARRNGVPASWFLAMLHAESNFNPSARSHAGAIGVGQLMPGTARGLGVDPYDWRQNIRGSARYFAQQYKQFGRPDLALSAYNSGPGGSESSGRVEGFKETQAYVRRVTELELKYRELGGGEPFAGVQTADAVVTPTTPPQLPSTPPPTTSYLDNLERLGPLSARVAGQAARFTPTQREAPPDGTQGAGPQLTPTGAGPVRPDHDDGWMGSKSVAQQFANIGTSLGLQIVSEKRDRRNTKSGGVSDHWVGSRDSYAFDLSNGSGPTPQMDQAAIRIARQLGLKNYKPGQRLEYTTTINGYRVQVLYRTQTGGNHDDHIHVGVRRVGGK